LQTNIPHYWKVVIGGAGRIILVATEYGYKEGKRRLLSMTEARDIRRLYFEAAR
jgi:hypothetical protein